LKIRIIATVIKDSFKELSKNDPLRMAGATAFFTTFALPPILIILIYVFGNILHNETISIKLFRTIGEMTGLNTEHQLITTFKNIKNLALNFWVTAGGVVFLLFISTTLFNVIKDSLNQIWRIRIVEKRILYNLENRLKSIGIILFAGIFFLIGLLLESLQILIGKELFEFSSNLSTYYNFIIAGSISLILVTAWFFTLFRFLPDGHPSWRILLIGSIVTSILFNCGKFIFSLLLAKGNIDTVYGASGSIVLLLLFVFYSALILYFGAAFIKVWSAYKKVTIVPLHYASHYKIKLEE
jgi:membrane protein